MAQNFVCYSVKNRFIDVPLREDALLMLLSAHNPT